MSETTPGPMFEGQTSREAQASNFDLDPDRVAHLDSVLAGKFDVFRAAQARGKLTPDMLAMQRPGYDPKTRTGSDPVVEEMVACHYLLPSKIWPEAVEIGQAWVDNRYTEAVRARTASEPRSCNCYS